MRLFSTALVLLTLPCSAAAVAGDVLRLKARQRTETAPGSNRFHATTTPVEWQGDETAIIVCDMWDAHWCRGATARVAEMAPRMNEVLKAARAKGALVIHCPSSCMDFYEGTPERKLAQAAPPVATEPPLEGWRPLDPARESPLPIDDSDGGCDCDPPCSPGSPWKRQIAALDILPGDAVTDSAEAYYLMRQRGIKNVIVMGVHANMCVLGRPFAIRQLVTQGQNVVLMRDMTDAMYNSRSAPHVSHFSGNDLVVEHIERFWCPTIISHDLVGQGEFRFVDDKRPHVALIMAEDEYDTARTLSEFAAARLRKEFRVSLIYGSEPRRDDIPGIDAAGSADVVVLSVRRLMLPKEQLAVIRDHVAAGKGLVGIRTASHAFSPRGDEAVPAGRDQWPEFDHEVLGGNYTGHFGNKGEGGQRTMVRALAKARLHPILAGVPSDEFPVGSWLYKTRPLAETATPLVMGRLEGEESPQPVAWANRAGKSRVFYTSLGHPADFKLAAFTRLLENGIRWAAVEKARGR